eukprot:COSAG01_NODE_2607_length_7390_cov_77.965574_7_plen_114_part_00
MANARAGRAPQVALAIDPSLQGCRYRLVRKQFRCSHASPAPRSLSLTTCVLGAPLALTPSPWPGLAWAGLGCARSDEAFWRTYATAVEALRLSSAAVEALRLSSAAAPSAGAQ